MLHNLKAAGFNLIELALVLLLVGILTLAIVPAYNSLFGSTLLDQYAQQIELMVLRAKDHAQQMDKPVAICFGLTQKCAAEGVLSASSLQEPQNLQEWSQALQSDAQLLEHSDLIRQEDSQWYLVEALPMSNKVAITTNFSQQRLMIRADGQGVLQPGSIFLCGVAARDEKITGQRILVSRSASVRQEPMDQSQIQKYCT